MTKIDFLPPGGQLYFVRDQAPKEKGFTTIFGTKVYINWFFHSLILYSISFGNILHIFCHKTGKLVTMSILESLQKKGE